jgi:hypothetical protein
MKLKKPNRNRTEKTGKKPSQTGKTESNRKKPSQTEPNRFEPVFLLKNRTGPKPVGLNWFRFFFFINFGLIIFFDKNKTKPNRK